VSASLAIILAEDRQAQNLAYHLLVRLGYKSREVLKLPLPANKGAGDAYVLQEYERQVKAVNQRAADTILVVHLDADKGAVARRRADLEQRLQQEGLSENEGTVFLWIPKRNVETWLVWLLDPFPCDESTDYKGEFQRIYGQEEAKSVKVAALAFFEFSRPKATRPLTCPPSLEVALDNAPPKR